MAARRSSARRKRTVIAPLIGKLRKLTPTEFEHLSYDLLVLSGLRNATWRTPGADAGRDIEGEYLSADLSETFVLERWYVECKHYATAVDWPLIFAKIAYAQNHGADFLLLVTTGNVSPRAKEEIARRDTERLRPYVRVWDAPLLETLVMRHPLLLEKYGLVPPTTSSELSPGPNSLVSLAAKVIQSAYGDAVLKGIESRGLDFAAALVDLLVARQKGWRGRSIPFRPDRDAYAWLKVGNAAGLEGADAHGLRALLAATRFYLRLPEVTIEAAGETSWSIPIPSGPVSRVIRDALHTIALWANLDIRVLSGEIRATARGVHNG